MLDLTRQSIRELLGGLRKRDFSARELTDATLGRIEKLNPALNAIIALDAHCAREQAAASDDLYARGEARPLEGLPISVKDAWDAQGFRSVVGDPTLKDYFPEADAVPVARLRAAGAIILGKSNTPLLCGDFQTYNDVFGVTNNPWNLEYSPGGSSGGAAVAVASGMSAFELGSDLGGSIRWPAALCGIFGLKPTWSLIPMSGHTPPKQAFRSAMTPDLAASGPMARSAQDLDLLLPILAQTELPPPRARKAAELRVAIWFDDFAPVDSRVAAAVEHAADLLEKEGAQVNRAARPDFALAEVFEIYGLIANAIVLAGAPEHVRKRLAAEREKYAPDDLSYAALQARAARFAAGEFSRLSTHRKALRAKIAEFFESFDVLLAPIACAPWLRHQLGSIASRVVETDVGDLPYFDLTKWAAPASLLRLPAVSAPVMRAANGLPLGVQIICAEKEDRTAIAAASFLERATGRFAPPPPFAS